MQLVPLVLALFLVLSMSVVSLQKKAHETLLLRTRLLEHLSLESQLKEQVLDVFFESQESKRKKTKSSKRSTSYRNKRCFTAATRNSRLGLAGLLKEESDPHLYEVAHHLLTLLYKNSPDIDPSALLEEIVTKGKMCLQQDPKRQHLSISDLPLPSPMLMKAIRGTNGYSFIYGRGIPKIEDFFALYIKGMKQGIVAQYASFPLLIASLGEVRANWIIKNEEEGENTLNLEEIEALLLEKKLPLTPQQRQLFTNQKFPAERGKGKQIVVMAPRLQLEARQTLCTYQIKGSSQQEENSKQTPSTPGV